MPDLLASLSAPPSGRSRPVWFDSLAYCRAKLLADGPLPWASPGELAAFTAKAQGMFGSDALLVDVADLCAERAMADPELRAAMGLRSRAGYALRTLLADDTVRTTAVDAVGAVSGGGAGTPVVLSMPSPARWLTISSDLAGQPAEPADADRADTAAMYVADFLRVFGTVGVDGLLLDEGPVDAAELVPADAYRPVLNVAENYSWPTLIGTPAAAAWPNGAVAGVAGWIGTAAPQPAGPTWGWYAGADFWTGGDVPSDAGLVFAVVPEEADPDSVMARV
ncbi:MAG TPA: hypothetical protein VE074_18270, partial [Jatrophihabitantaceae bacterium]|nr:hypothetical protein [Jatrophihabitantaceae bacterium]